MLMPEVRLTRSEALHSDDMARPKATSINLDALFRTGSAARRIAERLMTGKPQSRAQLVAGLGTSVTTVNRVVAQLEKAGAIITGRSVQTANRPSSGWWTDGAKSGAPVPAPG